MRKLTPEERAAKRSGQVHVHTADCGHDQPAPAVEAPAVEEVAVEAPAVEEVVSVPEEAPAEDEKPKRGRKKAEETPAEDDL